MGKILQTWFLAGALLSCQRNHPPVISEIVINPENRNAGTIFTLTAKASDEDGELLNYEWSSDMGTFPEGAGSFQAKWQSPLDGTGKTAALTVKVSDGKAEVSRDTQLLLTEVLYGSIEGNTSFKSCTIRIPEVSITIGDTTVTTDDNGHFSIIRMPIGTYTLKAYKEEFGPVSQQIRINKNSWTVASIAMTSTKYTGKVSGLVTDMNREPISGMVVSMLNPDGQESGLTTTTNSSGYYQIYYIPLGKRYIRARKATNEEFRFDTWEKEVEFSAAQQDLDIRINKVALNGMFTDPRDHTVYNTRIIGTQTWMSVNLKYLPRVYPPDQGSDKQARYYVYNYSGEDTAAARRSSGYFNYGALYNFEAALTGCPPGWRLPDEYDFQVLTNYLGDQAALKLKSVSGWLNSGNGNNSSGFGAVPAGSARVSGSTFSGIGEVTYFWTSSIANGYNVVRMLMSQSDRFFSTRGNPGSGFSVRCIKTQ